MRMGTKTGLGWFAAVLSSLPFLPGTAMAQTPGPASVQIIQRPGACGIRCGTFLVNNSKTDRAVATVIVTVAGDEVHMTDFGRNSFPFRTPSTQIVLLFPGQEFRFEPSIDLHGPQGAFGPQTRPITYTVAGSYVPRPDLMELPRGRAQDWVRIREMDFGSAFPTACPLGPAHFLRARNLNLARSVAVSFRNTTPGSNTGPQTLYLAPGEERPVGCANEWQNIQFIGAEFAG